MFGFGGKREAGKKLVLHIDDEPDIRALIRFSLEAIGVEVLSAADGPSGLKLAAKLKPDLVLLDIRMPTIDGFETCASLRKLPSMKGVPILMLTALSQLKDVERAMGEGADGYVIKPVEVPKLREKVAEALGLPAPSPKPPVSKPSGETAA